MKLKIRIHGGTAIHCEDKVIPFLKVQEDIRDPQPSKPDKEDGAQVWQVGSKRKREDDLVEDYQKVKRLRKGEWWPSQNKPALQKPAPRRWKTEGQQKRAAQTKQASAADQQRSAADLQEQLAAALERAAKAEEERKAAARDLARTQALQRLARTAEQDAIKKQRTLRTQKHHVRAERDNLMAKAIIAKQKAKWLRGTASKQARLELKQMRDDREARQIELLSQSDVGRQLAAAKETVRELSNKLIKQRTWRKEAAAIFRKCGVQGPSFMPNTAPAQRASSLPMPAQHASSPPAPALLFPPVQHASLTSVRAQCAASVLRPAQFAPLQHASAPPAPAQCATSLFLPAQHASSAHVSARCTASLTPPSTPPLFKEQTAMPQFPVAQLFSTLEQICAHFCL